MSSTRLTVAEAPGRAFAPKRSACAPNRIAAATRRRCPVYAVDRSNHLRHDS
jgi:hypothetical protein